MVYKNCGTQTLHCRKSGFIPPERKPESIQVTGPMEESAFNTLTVEIFMKEHNMNGLAMVGYVLKRITMKVMKIACSKAGLRTEQLNQIMKPETGVIMEISEKRVVTLFGRILLLLMFISTIACKESKKLVVPYYDDPTFTPVWNISKKSNFHTIARFNFSNQYGEAVSNRTFQNKVCLVNFFFTSCPSICPKLMQTMNKVYTGFIGNSDVAFLSHSVTPEIDNINRLYKYASQNGYLSEQWHLVTGNKAEIYNLARKSYFIEEEMGVAKTSSQFLHTENFVLIDKKGHIRGIYNGTLEAEVPRITEDIKALLEE
jgi:protein SCO1/2